MDGLTRSAGHNAVELIEKLEERFRVFFDTVAVAIWVHDFRPLKRMLDHLRACGVHDLRRYIAEHPSFVAEAKRSVLITDVNTTALKMLNVSDKHAFFKRLSDFLPTEDESFARCIVAIDEGLPSFTSETSVMAATGEMIPIVVALNFPPDAGLGSIIGCMTDIRERVKHENEIVRTRADLDRAFRVASMGQLTATIAHEVIQPLSAVMNYAKAAKRWLDQTTPEVAEAKALIERIESAAQHSAGVVKNVRRSMGEGGAEFVPLAFDKVAAEAVRYARAGLEPEAAIVFSKLDAADGWVLGDRILLQQVIINIFVNAAQAMEHLPVDKRRLTIRTAIFNSNLVFEVEDAGPGIPDEMKGLSFPAFRTTKKGGMGLGLSISRSTIETHGGRIELADADGGGALVSFSLPLMRPISSAVRDASS